MPLIDDPMIDSLKAKQGRFKGTWSPFALYLLGAIPKHHGKRLPPESDWRPKIICTKITAGRKRSIENEARRLKEV